MEKGDILTLAAGLIIVLVVAVIANPQNLAFITGAGQQTPPAVIPVTTVPGPTMVTSVSVKPIPPLVLPDAPPYRIYYTDKPFEYPAFKLPENMETYGASDIVSRSQERVPFAFVEGNRGGLTQVFSVPYPVWIINTTVIANRTPQYGKFQMVLCYADNGAIIEGEEILNRGSSYRIVQTSNTKVYMIISTAYIDSYYISLEAPREYYDKYRPR